MSKKSKVQRSTADAEKEILLSMLVHQVKRLADLQEEVLRDWRKGLNLAAYCPECPALVPVTSADSVIPRHLDPRTESRVCTGTK